MELRISAFKGSPWQCGNTHEAVLEVRGRNADPDKLLGAHLVWRTPTGRVIRGKVVKRHGHLTGSKVVARFHKGLSGDALGQRVEVREAKGGKVEKRTATQVSKRATPAKAPSGPVSGALKVKTPRPGKTQAGKPAGKKA
jgi:large subunit ribosomal protein L35Ae